jgi:3-keto-disaccharide hydrolase
MRARLMMAMVLTFLIAFATASQSAQRQKGWIALFNGKDLAGWRLRTQQGPNGWKVVDGVYVNNRPSTDLQTDSEYYDFQLHVEFRVTEGDGNSGVYLRDKYEIQIFNSYGKPPVDNGCGALYKKIAPSVNASKREGEWQTFDVTFIGRRLTVFHNDRKILDNVDVGPMGTGAASNRADGPGPLRLQGDHDTVSFRNIRIRPLSKEDAEKLQKQLDTSSHKT